YPELGTGILYCSIMNQPSRLSRRTVSTCMKMLLFILAALLLAGCATVNPYRVQKPIETITTKGGNKVPMGYVEIDDMGNLQSFDQLKQVTDKIKAESATAPKGLRIVVYVHGWNNNASPE